MQLVRIVFLIAMALLLAGCARGGEPAAQQPETRSTTAARQPSNDELIENTRETALRVCEDAGARQVAKELGLRSHGNLDRIAKAYARELANKGPHRDASYVGCLEGFTRSP